LNELFLVKSLFRRHLSQQLTSN